jgi:uncharacterized protein with HEPN domain
MSAKRDPEIVLDEILDSIEAIFSYTQGLDSESFATDRKTFDATCKQIENIGELVGQLPEAVRASHAHLPWQRIKDMRNLLVHAYHGVDPDIVWDVVRNKLDPVKKALLEARKQLIS